MNTQVIGIDLGRGFTKAYTEYNGSKECKFKSIVGQGRSMDFSEYKDPIYIEVDSEDYFVGLLAEKEGDNPTRNAKDDKTTLTATKLLYAVLNELAVSNRVKIMLGVPNKLFRKSTLELVQNAYMNKEIKILDKIKGSTKNITIEDISIFRESDAALIYTVNTHKNKHELQNKVLGMVTVGFRTTELSYFDKSMKFIDKNSKTLEKGNESVLEYVQKKIQDDGLTKELHEIDTSEDYNKLKNIGYINLLENIDQNIENVWKNQSEMKLFIAGGTSLQFNDIPNRFELVDDPQFVTAKGLNYIGERKFK